MLIASGFRFHTAVENVLVNLRRRNVSARVPIDGTEVWVVASYVFVPNPSILGFLPKEVWDCAVNTTVPECHRTLTDIQIKLAFEKLAVRNGEVIHSIEESKDLRRYVLFPQIVRVDILAFIIVRLLGCFQHCRSQLGVRHTHCLDFIKTSQPTEVDFVLQVVLTNVNQSLGGINVMFTIELRLGFFLRGERTVNVKRYAGFLNRHTEVSFNSFKG